MPFPVLPVFYAGSSQEEISKLSVTGSALFRLKDESELSIITSNTSFIKNSTISIEFESKIEISKIIELLNNGVSKIFGDLTYSKELIEAGIPSSRIGLKLNSTKEISENESFNSYILPSSEPLGDLKSASNNGKKNIYISLSESSTVTINSLAASNLIPIIDAKELTTEKDSSKTSISDLFINSLTTDRKDGLFTTLVTDIHNHSLGLVYSSKESISEAIRTKTGVYQSRRHGLWYKGATSGATQELIKLDKDCDGDCLKFVVKQSGVGFCHLEQDSCFGDISGLTRLEKTLTDRLQNAPEGSYTKRLFTDEKLLVAKIKEEAEELTEAETKEDIAWEAADLFYFALTRCVKNGVSLEDIERNLDLKGLKITRRKGDAKSKFIEQQEEVKKETKPTPTPAKKEEIEDPNEKILMGVVDTKTASEEEIEDALKRPVQKTSEIMKLVNPIVDNVRQKGDEALLEYTAKFDGVKLSSPIIKAPFDPKSYEITQELKDAIDISIENVHKFHKAQLQDQTLHVETQPGIVCSRFARPIESVGLYVPGGTAVLPSTTLMLGVPAQVAGCKNIIIASPPRKDGSISPEVVYIAHKIGASAIVLAGGAQAVAAMAYGTQTIPKVDKILGPGNQFVTAAKMYVQNDTSALCSIDMPAGPSEVLVVADKKADPDFVASDLLSQAEHGIDSQVILIGIDLSSDDLKAIEDSVHEQALKLPRVDIVRKCIKHSTTLLVSTVDEAFDLSNKYAPEHLILQIENAKNYISKVFNAGSVFVGAYSPESLGDYSSGTNHTLPTYGYAKMYSGVNTATFQKFITSQDVTPEGLKNIGHAVMSIAKVEGLDAHRNAVKIRMEKLGLLDKDFV
ncbi:histidinol dehydrogenase [Wickerhamomyces ciferrii]|uniref:Histidine biosynthesis trifunctional protein n=1 Tax=Wickerhamomyces ciferrii (strain ATCC 14091 / BCRC 22168 / CBS 111 / JCM 3599 / NBRC 0793 / NRRL Y-1031 F-60-10) TaxID=1206466 RepID=K0KWP3_WICCF|nr:histidinol dehydrogenase [Wickerhamomyces ciferrii]CCH46447.1 histidinol dehydrogenase [Wickerhamomyces ciferrii]